MTTALLVLKTTNPWMYYIFFGIVGAIIGSFLNVCIYRMPRGESVVIPRSKCTHCDTVLRWFDMIPIVSFWLLKGRCRDCGARISNRYWIVESITALTFIISATLPTTGEIIGGCVLSSILIGISGIDLEHYLIEDKFIMWGSSLGILLSVIFPVIQGVADISIPGWDHVQGGIRSFLGMMIGGGLGLWVMLWGEKIFKKEAFGFGDVLLLGVIGSFCGWQGVFFSLFGGSLIAVFFLIPLMLIERVCGLRIGPRKVLNTEAGCSTTIKETATTSSNLAEDKSVALQFGVAIPFGPWLALGAIVYFWFFRTEFTTFFNATAEVFVGR